VRVGIDSYSYHRLLGEVRPGERAVGGRIAATKELIGEMIAAGAEILSLETVFLDPPERLDAGALLAAAGDRELALAWGHPLGLEWGAQPARLDELRAWIEMASALGARIVRCVAAGPALRNASAQPRFVSTVRALRRAAAHARAHGVTLVLENHGDVAVRELCELLDAVPGLGVCLDTANALRVGDDPVALARRVAGRVAMVHLKDVEAPAAGLDPLVGPSSVAYGTGVVDLDGVLAALPADPALPVCVELGHLGGADVDERALVRQGVAWLAERRATRAGSPRCTHPGSPLTA
jgi:sugar phosphate isomerase/epimerase